MYEYEAKITRVVDGDTLEALIDVGFHTHISSTLRLYGIDTPEKRTRNEEEKEKGIAASKRVEELLRSCHYKVLVKSHGLGKYGRCLAEVLMLQKDGSKKNLNSTLLSEGHAVEYLGGSR